MEGISPNFIKTFILARSRLGLSFFTNLWPLIDGFNSIKSATAGL